MFDNYSEALFYLEDHPDETVEFYDNGILCKVYMDFYDGDDAPVNTIISVTHVWMSNL